MGMEGTLIVLMVAATAVAMIVQRLRLPYTVALVLTGLGLGPLAAVAPQLGLSQLKLTPDLLFAVFLPVLLFEAAFQLSWRKFRENVRAILLLAVPGVVASMGIAGLLAYLLEPLVHADLPLSVSFLFVAMLAATDPVSIIALFKELGVPKRLAVMMEGESLLNDGVAVVAYMAMAAVLGLHLPGEPVTAVWVAQFFLWEVGLGIVIGIGVGLLVSYVTTLIDDHLVEIMLTTLAAFGAYVIAEALHASFALAVVASGMACGNVGARFGMTPTNRIAVESFWEYMVFVANSFVFLLIGKEIDLGRLLSHAVPILVAWGVLTVSRLAVIYGVTGLLRFSRERVPRRWPTVLVWGGLRGALSMVLAVGLPTTLPQRDLLIDLVFGVVLLSILVQGLTMGPLLAWAHVTGGGGEKRAYMRVRGSLRATREALRKLDQSLHRDEIAQETYDVLRERLGGRLAQLEESLRQFEPEAGALRSEELQKTHDRLLEVERQAIRDSEHEGIIDEDAARELLREIDRRGLDVDDLIAAAKRTERRAKTAESGKDGEGSGPAKAEAPKAPEPPAP